MLYFSRTHYATSKLKICKNNNLNINVISGLFGGLALTVVPWDSRICVLLKARFDCTSMRRLSFI